MKYILINIFGHFTLFDSRVELDEYLIEKVHIADLSSYTVHQVCDTFEPVRLHGGIRYKVKEHE